MAPNSSSPSSSSGAKAALALIGKRFASSLLTLLLVSLVVFTIAQLLPGDAAQEALGQSATAEQVAALRHDMGLDRPAHERYVSWLSGMVSGDPGQSLVANLPVSEVISSRLPNSLLLAALSALVAVPVALSIGIGSAMNRGGKLDRALNISTLSMVAVPEFLVATLAVLIFSVKLRWLPSIALVADDMSWGDYLRGAAMPILALSIVVIAQMARMTRAAVIDQMDRPYVEMAVLKGVAPVRVVLRHIMPNAVAPIVNAMALSLSYLLGGAIIVETIFNYPGLASLMVNAVTSRDMPLLQACAMIFCAAYLILMLIADVTAILANPRLRAQ
ncbi:ABC transporter permease [Sphingobium sp. SJ10-10]|uniref:ABC transporter permease n=1 Tax=unclassified Sphingobium TaxID=2611147 RepID=UPI00077037D8|nr:MULTISPECIES: ABC transporter permease [Sphingomonadaceae]AMK23857.1 binding-protein-dependent transport systems inner membrane component [Sphingobium sp. TKS]MEC6701123.1 ABC transporter permease [Sphingobium sp. SJ10-10]NML89618.1 ABC transporter permease [Sphingobium sp. TB-6]